MTHHIGLLLLLPLVHEAVWLAQYGQDSWNYSGPTAFGWCPDSDQRKLLHISFITSPLLVLIQPQMLLLHVAVTLAYCAAHPRRLSNHLVVYLFVVLCLYDTHPFASISWITGAMYGIAAIHKCNPIYLGSNASIGWLLARAWFAERTGRQLSQIAYPITTSVVVIAETVLAITVCCHIPFVSLPVAAAIHLGLGLLCHVHFSYLSLVAVGLASNIWPLYPNSLLTVLVTIVGSLVAILAGARSPFKLRSLVFMLYLLFGAFFVSWCLGAIALSTSAVPLGFQKPGPLGFLLIVLFIANGFAPYLGIKSEYSMAMFSNITPSARCHYFIPCNGLERLRIKYYIEIREIRMGQIEESSARAMLDYFPGFGKLAYSRAHMRHVANSYCIKYGTAVAEQVFLVLSPSGEEISITEVSAWSARALPVPPIIGRYPNMVVMT